MTLCVQSRGSHMSSSSAQLGAPAARAMRAYAASARVLRNVPQVGRPPPRPAFAPHRVPRRNDGIFRAAGATRAGSREPRKRAPPWDAAEETPAARGTREKKINRAERNITLTDPTMDAIQALRITYLVGATALLVAVSYMIWSHRKEVREIMTSLSAFFGILLHGRKRGALGQNFEGVALRLQPARARCAPACSWRTTRSSTRTKSARGSSIRPRAWSGTPTRSEGEIVSSTERIGGFAEVLADDAVAGYDEASGADGRIARDTSERARAAGSPAPRAAGEALGAAAAKGRQAPLPAVQQARRANTHLPQIPAALLR